LENPDYLLGLINLLGQNHVLSGDDAERYLSDWSGDHRGIALAVVRPATVTEVQETMRFCALHNICVVPQGGNTGLVSGALQTEKSNCVVVSLERINRVRSIDTQDFLVEADAGCILQTLKEKCEDVERLLPISLGAQGSCQIGGNISTNAGGLNVLRYGMSRDLVLGLEVVLPDGSLWSDMKGLRKNNCGYDLKHLFIGAEGSLGIVTGVQLKTFPKPQQIQTAYLGVESFTKAIELFSHARIQCSDLISAFEVVGSECMVSARLAIPDYRDVLTTSAKVHIIMELTSSAKFLNLREIIEKFLTERIDEGLVVDAVLAESNMQAKKFWSIREGVVEGQVRRGFHVRSDISVRLSQVPHLVQRVRDMVLDKFEDWSTQVYGHAGDGNIHISVLPPEIMSREIAKLTGKKIEIELMLIVDEMHGGISAEHGIGRTKRATFWNQASDSHLKLIRGIKNAIDPKGLINPGCFVEL